ncbi:S8 family serine peptidase [Candidatus Pacearchaeota archaeon]|nr:S8 family serine peptidase [Candidatus Pacearchaeota archaeon]
MKLKIFLIIITAIFLITLSISLVNAEIAKAKVDMKVIDKVSKGEKARVFIKFRETGLKINESKILSSKSNYDAQEKEIQAFNKNKRNLVSNEIGKNKVRHEFQDTISAEIGKEDLNKLQQQDFIEKIEEVGVRHIMLQDSVVLINASRTHSLGISSVNLTGRGESICVIDTGVNYSHESLGNCYGNNSVSSGCKVVGGYDFVNSDSDPRDDHGHGTHVAGIAAANGSIKGVAPGARIIGIKVCDSGGACSDDDIIAGINWCVGNSTTYNISVISLSLGSGLYSTYCNNDSLAPAINSAVGANISVAIASGNGLNNDGNGNSNQIASPACVQNATAVGATDKSDSITSYSDRNSLMSLLAPGGTSSSTMSQINSTCLGGGYCGNQGTSMATPHVSGSIALIKEYLSLTGRTRTAKQVETILNNTGLRISDSASGINYTRINAYQAIISIDNFPPNVTLLSPGNNSVSVNQNQTFRCNMTDLSLKNVSFYLWNSSSVFNQSFRSISSNAIAFEINITNLALGAYNWNCLVADENNNTAFAISNFTFTIASLDVNLLSPNNGLKTRQNQTFSCNATSNNLFINMSFYIWNSSGAITNITNRSLNGTQNTTNISFNFTLQDDYQWNCLFVNNQSALSFASNNYTISYDLTSPRTNITSPINASYYNSARLNVSLNENGSCIYSFDYGNNNYSMVSSDNKNFSAVNSTLLQGDYYNVTFYCNDSAGNINNSDVYNFNIDLSKPNVSLLTPIDGYSVSASSTALNFTFNVSDNLNISYCNLILNGDINITNSSIINQSLNHSFTQTLYSGTYTWGINCSDQAGNIGNSSLRSITISAPASSTSSSAGGGGGGGGSNAQTFVPSSDEVNRGFTRDLSKNDKIKFLIYDIKAEQHIVEIKEIGKDYVNITVNSTIVNLLLGIGQSAKINLTSANYYDLYIKLENITVGKAKLTIQLIKEIINNGKIGINESLRGNGSNISEDNENQTMNEDGKERDKREGIISIIKNKITDIILIILLAFIISGIFYLFELRRDKKLKKDIIRDVKKELRVKKR